ncbi:MAG: DUF2335 domain-containing protein [Prevotellaceae bacterium]|jgi:uncharacterized membrane protein|nr:DUF2335 domain-containing protein [Prevotellaceae bacterium]
MGKSTKNQTDEQDLILKRIQEEGVEDITRVDEILASLPEDKKEIILAAFSKIEESSYSFQGPIPHPEIMRGYEEVLPGAAERLLSMAEKQQAHNMEINKTLVDKQTRLAANGQSWGGFLAILCVSISCLLGYLGHDVLAGTLGTTTIIGLGIIFVLHKKPSEKGKTEK